jgi:hypothetical protein
MGLKHAIQGVPSRHNRWSIAVRSKKIYRYHFAGQDNPNPVESHPAFVTKTHVTMVFTMKHKKKRIVNASMVVIYR